VRLGEHDDAACLEESHVSDAMDDRGHIMVLLRAAAGDEGGRDSGTLARRCSSGSSRLPGAAGYLLGCGDDDGVS
jgi:hypothetical protein